MKYPTHQYGSTGPPKGLLGAAKRRTAVRTALFWLPAYLVIAAPAPATAQSESGSKLVGTEVIGPAEQGWSVALSADGKTVQTPPLRV